MTQSDTNEDSERCYSDMEVVEEDLDSDEDNSAHEESTDDSNNVYMPGQPLNEDEELVFDETAYEMLHNAGSGSPCLSFDLIVDKSTADMSLDYPLTAYLVAGTQGSRNKSNIMIVKLWNLHSIKKETEDEDSSDEEEDDDDDDDDDDDNNRKKNSPKMAAAMIKHKGCVNRIRFTNLNDINLAASWSELGIVSIWEISDQIKVVDDKELLKNYIKENKSASVQPLFSFNGHQHEGFALDWSPIDHLVLASGDCQKNIHIWKPSENGQWNVDQRPLIGHTASVEDLQWSPNEKNVLASCSVDKTIRVWDIRSAKNQACMLTKENAHQNDVNVISWNSQEPFIASGGDDGYIHVWDLRNFTKEALVTFKHHISPVSTIEWNPNEKTVFASGGEDDQIVQWDLSVERDDSEQVADDVKDIPEQLLFIHQGQKDIKELHWHPQLPGVIVSTALSGFNIFKTISI